MERTYGVETWGYVIDPVGRASFVFGAGDNFKEFRRQNEVNLNQQITDQENIFGYVFFTEILLRRTYLTIDRTIRMRKRGVGTLVPLQNAATLKDDVKRDQARKQFSAIMAAQLCKWSFRPIHVAGSNIMDD